MTQYVLLLFALCAVASVVTAAPDSDVPPLPGPGLAYGGIPYGSMSGNVAEFFKRQVTSTGQRSNYRGYAPAAVDYSPIERWL